ncbi:sensor histidine kinase [Dyadobacter sp. CY351]|uniref:sensor histidine kinase n=1 Tax=Dyadobacter sp. CY351 TaxID=2909337 RepID=UPI001F3396B4|nr:histidine kinase [Dyadobacter sp. CY351]MCF2517050.1 histidine kinase [Dyadobacter sp. CY351]
MRLIPVSTLFSKQEWQLAAGIVCIYLPVRIFVSNVALDGETILNKMPLWSAEFAVNLLFFRIWIAIIGAIQYSSGRLDATFTFRFPRRLFTYAVGLVLAVLFNFAFIFLWRNMEMLLAQQLQIVIKRTEQEIQPFNRQQKAKANTGLTVMAMLATIYMVSVKRSNEQLEQVSLRAAQLEKENLQTRFIALKSQLSPHFLFNSLSILTSIIEKNPQQSVVYVNRLSKSYRYILDHSDLESVTLKTELDFIEAYVFLLKSRFEEKMHVHIEIPAAAHYQYKIAPLTLQLLIENAVKHNQMSLENPLHISIEMIDFQLIISNLIRKRNNVPASAEIGLSNIIRRYGLLTKEPVTVSETGVSFVVKIPLLT